MYYKMPFYILYIRIIMLIISALGVRMKTFVVIHMYDGCGNGYTLKYMTQIKVQHGNIHQRILSNITLW